MRVFHKSWQSYAGMVLVAASTYLAGCASTAPPGQVSQLGDAELLRGAPFAIPPERQLGEVDLLGVSDEMREFIDWRLSGGGNNRQAVLELIYAIQSGDLKLNYDNGGTYTAAETFARGEGNCLSFTNLFIALAREAGINARYQEVEVPATWLYGDEVYLYNLHVNARVKLPTGAQMVDFDPRVRNLQQYRTRALRDEEALARYHSNRGVELLQEERFEESFLHLQRAISLRDYTAHFWNNLGTLYSRAGHANYAEAAYLKAVDLGEDSAALSNLSRLYQSQGRDELARYYERRVELFREKNPYYLFHLAEEAYAAADYEQAEDLLRSAIRKQRHEHHFHRLLGLTYVQLGEADKARDRFRRAETLAENPEQRALYQRKLQAIAGNTGADISRHRTTRLKNSRL